MNHARDGDEDEHTHDQLPRVDEIHEMHDHNPNGDRSHAYRKKAFCVVVLVIAVCLGASVGLIILKHASNTEKRQEEIQNFLSVVSLPGDLQKYGSPQQFASTWISRHDPIQLTVPSGMDDEGALEFISRYIAAVFYFSLGGSEWNDRFNFLTEDNICDWNRYYTDGTSEYALVNLGITCNINNEPRTIMMPNNNMVGSIPPELGLLTGLETLSLQMNSISGTLPEQMENLRYLSGAIFYANELSGTIPVWISSLTNLEWLSMASNSLNGSIPEELGSLTSLKLLNLQYNYNILGSIPESFQSLTNLERIYLSYNKLDGSIPSWIGNFKSLTDLRLSNNMLSSTIPTSLSNAVNLTALFLDDNDLTGNLNVINSLSNLELLLIEDNSFEQLLDLSWLASLDKLKILDASNNKLYGFLHSHLFEKNELLMIDLHGNEIQGLIGEIPQNTALEFLSLYENQIVGNIPQSITNLKNLTHLDLSTNDFNGAIPANIGRMETLTYLFLASNNFDEGPIPNDLKNLSNLRELSLKETSRKDTIPEWIGNLSDLILLDLDHNDLTGTIPDMSDLQELAFLLLNNNKLSGTVPFDISALPQLRILLLDGNDLSGLGNNNESLPFCDDITGPLGMLDSVFATDCFGVSPQIECPCCTECCADGTECNDGNDFLANHDLIWEYGYNRLKFEFSNDTIFMVKESSV